MTREMQTGLLDLQLSLCQWRLWLRLAVRDIRNRYRRTVLGPLWPVMASACGAVCLGVVYAFLWKVDVAHFLPFLSAGIITWMLVVSVVTEGCQAFIANHETIKSTRLPYLGHIVRVLLRNLLVFAHSIPLHFALCLWCGVPITAIGLLALPFGAALLAANLLWLSTILAILCTRYRDLLPLSGLLLQLAFFLTPILWTADRLQGSSPLHTLLIDANPLFHLIDGVRAPLLGQPPSVLTIGVLLNAGLAGMVLALWLLGRTRARIAYWV